MEMAFPILDAALAAQVVDLLELQLADTVKGRALGPDGQVLRRGLASGPALRSQIRAYEWVLRRSASAPTRRL